MTQTNRLTRKQTFLVQELHEIASLVGVDYPHVERLPRKERMTYLEVARWHLIRGFVVLKYTMVDELLSCVLCNYFFGRKRSHRELWKTKRFRIFNHYIVEELFLIQKLRFAKAVKHVPRAAAADIERLNALRNGLAHAFFPENLRKSQPTWKGKNIFSLEGVRLFADDVQRVTDLFMPEFYTGRAR